MARAARALHDGCTIPHFKAGEPMHFQEVTEGGFRIYVGALESPIGDGYTAALVVRQSGSTAARDAFAEDRLACGHRWATAEDAMSYALRKGRAFVRERQDRIAA
jgi:hypothetical protein